VKVSLNAKREIQVEIKVYAGEAPDSVESARSLAVETFYETLRACGVGHAAEASAERSRA
jgi:hypothetical protein